MIVRKAQVPLETGSEEQVQKLGAFEQLRYSQAGGLTQFGAYVETLMPGSRSSNRHWHESEDEFLYMIAGEAVVIENDGEHAIAAGDSVCWPAGEPNGHQLVNRSNAPCTYVIVGARAPYDVVHYPDLGRVLYNEGPRWRMLGSDGALIKSGTYSYAEGSKLDPPPPAQKAAESRADKLERQERELRAEADELLARHGVLELLGEYGRAHVSGSYRLELMTWRDLDIYLEMPEVDVGRFLELGTRLGRALKPRKLSFTDHFNFPTTEAISGLYWGILTDALERDGWKLDIWAVTPQVCAERLAHCDAIAARVDARSRAAILAIKDEVCRRPAYRDTITSQHVYDAVLRYGAASLDDFWRIVRSTAENTK